jgi:hypothetical protein
MASMADLEARLTSMCTGMEKSLAPCRPRRRRGSGEARSTRARAGRQMLRKTAAEQTQTHRPSHTNTPSHTSTYIAQKLDAVLDAAHCTRLPQRAHVNGLARVNLPAFDKVLELAHVDGGVVEGVPANPHESALQHRKKRAGCSPEGGRLRTGS